MKEKVKKVIKENNFDNVWCLGEFNEENEVIELIKNTNYIYFQLEKIILRFKAVESYGKISVKIFEDYIYEYSEEVGRVSLGDFIFINPLINNKIRRIGFVNLEDGKDELIADFISIKLDNGQELFMDPSFFQLKIGGIDQKKFWEKNLQEAYRKEMKVTWI